MEERPNTPRSDGFYRKRKIDPLLHKKYFSKYRTIKKLGEGSFGKVYKAEYKNEYFAIKFEDKEKGQNLLEIEATIMDYLKGQYIPMIKSFGYNENYNILVMQLMGRSLEQIFNKTIDKKFSLKTTSLLAYQMLSILKYIHDRHIIHRDIKPDNFVLGLKNKNANLFLIDFGLAKKYRSSKTLEQNPYVKKRKLTGTARYASIHALEEMEQSRRDDLEAVGYVLIYFLKGHLPWMGMRIKSKEDRIKKILNKKKETSVKDLCKDLPEEYREFLEYSRNLGYTEEPKYEKFKKNFYDLVTNKNKEQFDYIYDWTTENDLKKRKIESSNNNITINNNKDKDKDKDDNKAEINKNIEIKNKIEKIDMKEEEKNNELNIYISRDKIEKNNLILKDNNNINIKEEKNDEFNNYKNYTKSEKNIINTINIKESSRTMNDKVDLKCCIMYVNNIFNISFFL